MIIFLELQPTRQLQHKDPSKDAVYALKTIFNISNEIYKINASYSSQSKNEICSTLTANRLLMSRLYNLLKKKTYLDTTTTQALAKTSQD